MKQMYLRVLSYSLFLILAVACGSPLQIERPAETYLPSPIEPALSEIPLNVDIDIKKLESSVNRKLTGLIYSGDSLMEHDLSVKVWKVQDFAFSVNNNTITYRLPLKIRAKYRWKVEKFGLSVSDEYEAQGTISVSFRTSVYINKDWKLFARTESIGYQWIEEPKLSVIGVKLPVTKIADIALRNSQESITKSIDKSLSDVVKLENQVASAWDMVQKPMLVNEENNLWIKITPQDIYVAPFVSKNNILRLGISFLTKIESVAGSEPAAGAPVPLPMFKQVSRQPQPFNLNIAADVTYATLSQISASQLVGKTFTEGKRSITITGLSLYSSEGKAVVAADVTGSLKGRIYFTGKMSYNTQKSALEITEADFDIKTKSVLVKSANWLLHGLILKKITPYLTYNVAEVLESTKKEVNASIAGYKLYDGITLKGGLDKMNVTEVSMVPGAVRIKANLSGNIGFDIGDMKF